MLLGVSLKWLPTAWSLADLSSKFFAIAKNLAIARSYRWINSADSVRNYIEQAQALHGATTIGSETQKDAFQTSKPDSFI